MPILNGMAVPKLTRRQLAGALGGAAPWLARPAEPEAETSEMLLQAARKRQRRNVERLAQCKVPMNAEPAFTFRA